MLGQESRLRRTVQQGKQQEQAGRWAEAATHYRGALSSFGGSPELHFRLGFAMERQEQFEAACSSYERALALDPGLEKARERLERLTNRKLKALIDAGRQKEAQENWEQAAALYRTALGRAKPTPELHFRLGFCQERQGAIEDARASYRAALSLSHDLAKAHFRLAFLDEQQGNQETAVAGYRTALDLRDSDAGWHFRYGKALMALERPEEAKGAFEQALAKDPNHAGARNGLEQLQYAAAYDNLDLTVVRGTQAAAPQNLSPQTLVPYCRLLCLDGQAEKALALLRKAPFSPDIKLLEGTIHQFQGNLDAAERCFALVANGGSRKVTALANIAHTHWLRGNRERAISLLHRLIPLYPQFLRPITLFGRFVEEPAEVERLLEDLRLQNGSAIPPRNYAQLVRACMRAEATDAAAYLAEAAAIRLAALSKQENVVPLSINEDTGLPKGAFTQDRGNIALIELAELGRQHSIRFFPMGGTLLGHVRDGALITWDKDLDLGCFADEATASDIRNLFHEHPRFLLESSFEDEHGLVKAKHFCGTPIDIFINVRHPDRITHSGQIITWYNEPFELEPTEIMGAPLFLPADADKYLLEHYGPDWRTPDPHFDVFHECPTIQATNGKRMYIYGIAKAIDLIATGALAVLALRMERAKGLNSTGMLLQGFSSVLKHYKRYGG